MNDKEIVIALKNHSLKTQALLEAINLIKCQSEKLNKVKAILTEKNGVADSQEFGLSYSQAINYLETIEEIIKG